MRGSMDAYLDARTRAMRGGVKRWRTPTVVDAAPPCGFGFLACASEMVAVAESTGVYEVIEVADLVDFLSQKHEAYDLIVLAAVLFHFRALDKVLNDANADEELKREYKEFVSYMTTTAPSLLYRSAAAGHVGQKQARHCTCRLHFTAD